MPVGRRQYQEVPVNIVGGNTFGRYPKISVEKTFNMMVSDDFLVPFPGYIIGIPQANFFKGGVGRGNHSSANLNRLICVVGQYVYAVNIFFDQNLDRTFDFSITLLNPNLPLATAVGVVYIAENNTPQIAFSDNVNVYIYDPFNTNSTFYIATGDGANPSTTPIRFTPGFIEFHDTYFIVAATNSTDYTPPANNTWRLSSINPTTGFVFFDETTLAARSANTGIISTKGDIIQGVVRVPSKGNMIFIFGKTVTEPWYNQGLQLFPYARSTAYSIDYGCLNPATIASTDEIVVWLAQNEKSGPIILASTGGMPEKITTDGIDYLFSNLKNPSDSQGMIFRQDGHLIYLLNFYTDNLSLFYDFNTKLFFYATDQNLNHFIANEMAFFNNQYYFLSNKNGNLYAFDTIFTTYQDTDANGVDRIYEIPRIRVCKAIRSPDQNYRIANDIGFTIESGETPFQKRNPEPIFLITQDNFLIVTQGSPGLFITQDNMFFITQDNKNLQPQQTINTGGDNLILQEDQELQDIVPKVALSVSYDGGASFSEEFDYLLNPLGYRKNRLKWWQCGVFNDFTPQFKFWGLGRFVATNGILNVRS